MTTIIGLCLILYTMHWISGLLNDWIEHKEQMTRLMMGPSHDDEEGE